MEKKTFDRDFFVKAGRRGGIARKMRISKERRSEIAQLAARARWRKGKASA